MENGAFKVSETTVEDRKPSNNEIDCKLHITHYKKIKLNGDISLRYFFAFEDRPKLVGKWVIKSHSTKRYRVIDRATADLIAMSHNKELNNYKEIMGRYILESMHPTYRKVIIKNNKAKIIKED